MRLWLILLVLLFLSIACAPVKFSRLENEDSSQDKSEQEQAKELSMFEHYLKGDISRTYMIAWIFSDTENFRGTIYDIQVEIANTSSFDVSETDRILALEYDLNRIIHKFNDRNVFSRMYDVTAGILDKEFREDNYTLSISPEKLEKDGIDARAISNVSNGVVNSVLQNGFTIREVDLLCLKTCDLNSYKN